MYELPALMKLVGIGGLKMNHALMLHMFGKLTNGVGGKRMSQKTLGLEHGGDDLLEEFGELGLQNCGHRQIGQRRENQHSHLARSGPCLGHTRVMKYHYFC